jgi:hypothetical protein
VNESVSIDTLVYVLFGAFSASALFYELRFGVDDGLRFLMLRYVWWARPFPPCRRFAVCFDA